jgi:hypothetical protein
MRWTFSVNLPGGGFCPGGGSKYPGAAVVQHAGGSHKLSVRTQSKRGISQLFSIP